MGVNQEYWLIWCLRLFSLLLLNYSGMANASASDVEILLSAREVKTKNPNDFTLDSVLNAQLDVDDAILAEVHYSYSAFGVPASCGRDTKCIEANIKNANNPVIIFELKINNAINIPMGYMCDSFGVMTTSSKGMYDLFCGLSYILEWSGVDYVIKK